MPERPPGTGLADPGASLFLSVSDGAAAYAVLDYRLHDGRLPLGRLAVALERACLLGLVLITGSLWLSG